MSRISLGAASGILSALMLAACTPSADGSGGVGFQDYNSYVRGAAPAPAGAPVTVVPPGGGFAAKWLLLSTAVGTGQWWWAVVLVLGGLFTGGYVMLVLVRAMSSTAEPVEPMKPVARSREAVALAMSLCAVLLGLLALGPLELPALGSASVTVAAEAVP